MNIIIPGEDDLKGGAFVAPPECGLSITRRNGFLSPVELSAVSKSGFRTLELSSAEGEIASPEHMRGLGRQELTRSLRDNDLTLASLRSDLTVGMSSRRDRGEVRDGLRRLLDVASGLETPLAVAGAFCGDSARDSARFALDSLYDVADEIQESGVTIALESTYGNSFMFDPAAASEFLQNSPENIAAAVKSADLACGALSEGALGSISNSIRLGRIEAELDSERVAGLAYNDFSRKMLRLLTQSGFGGNVLMDLQNLRFSVRELSEIHKLATDFIPSACIG